MARDRLTTRCKIMNVLIETNTTLICLLHPGAQDGRNISNVVENGTCYEYLKQVCKQPSYLYIFYLIFKPMKLVQEKI